MYLYTQPKHEKPQTERWIPNTYAIYAFYSEDKIPRLLQIISEQLAATTHTVYTHQHPQGPNLEIQSSFFFDRVQSSLFYVHLLNTHEFPQILVNLACNGIQQ